MHGVLIFLEMLWNEVPDGRLYELVISSRHRSFGVLGRSVLLPFTSHLSELVLDKLRYQCGMLGVTAVTCHWSFGPSYSRRVCLRVLGSNRGEDDALFLLVRWLG